MGPFRSEFKENQVVSDDIQTKTTLLKDELLNSIKTLWPKITIRFFFSLTVMEKKTIDYEPTGGKAEKQSNKRKFILSDRK